MKINIFGFCFGASNMAQHTCYFTAEPGSLHDVLLVPRAHGQVE